MLRECENQIGVMAEFGQIQRLPQADSLLYRAVGVGVHEVYFSARRLHGCAALPMGLVRLPELLWLLLSAGFFAVGEYFSKKFALAPSWKLTVVVCLT
jgi:hypothetical protein